MKKILFSVAFLITFISFIPNSAVAGSANVLIIGKDGNVMCSTKFVGTKGMDSIINTASPCKFTYTLGWGDNFLDTINGAGWDGKNYWVLYVDNVYANKGVNEYDLDSVGQILWAYSDGSKTSKWFIDAVGAAQSVGSTASEGIVGLINPSTGGRVDSDGDGVADVDEYKNGTDPSTPDNELQVASVFASIIYMDADGDGVSDLSERRNGTDPFIEDQTEESKIKIAFKKAKEHVERLIDLFARL